MLGRPHIPFATRDHGLNTYRPPPMIMCPQPALLHIPPPNPNLSLENSGCPYCGLSSQLWRLKLATSPGWQHPKQVSPFLFSKTSSFLVIVFSCDEFIRFCLATVLANPTRNYTFNLSCSLGISWDGAVGYGSAKACLPLFPKLVVVIDESVILWILTYKSLSERRFSLLLGKHYQVGLLG